MLKENGNSKHLWDVQVVVTLSKNFFRLFKQL